MHTLTSSHSHILTPLQQFCVLHLHHRISPRWEWCSSCDSAHMTRHHHHRRLGEQKAAEIQVPQIICFRDSLLVAMLFRYTPGPTVPGHFQYCVWHDVVLVRPSQVTFSIVCDIIRSNTRDGWDPRMTPIQLSRKCCVATHFNSESWTCGDHWLSYV